MPRSAKFYFSPVNSYKGRPIKDGNGTLTIDCKHGISRFSKEAVTNLSLEGAYIKLYLDPGKNAIAFEIFREGQLKDLKGLRQLKSHTSNNGKYDSTTMSTGLSAALTALKIKKDHPNFRQLCIEKYEDKEMGKKFYYVVLDD